MLYPQVKDLLGNTQPASGYVAGLIAKSDVERGFWWSPSNYSLGSIQGTATPISFTLGSTTCDANLLNKNGVTTIIRQDGCRLWGDRTCDDPSSKWTFLNVRRIADTVNESLLKAHLWAVDQNITRNYVLDIEASVNGYLRSLKALGAIIDGKCWADASLNTDSNIEQGHIFFDFDFTPPYPAEHITFRSELVNDYLKEVFS